jgi:hypothetical protein
VCFYYMNIDISVCFQVIFHWNIFFQIFLTGFVCVWQWGAFHSCRKTVGYYLFLNLISQCVYFLFEQYSDNRMLWKILIFFLLLIF